MSTLDNSSGKYQGSKQPKHVKYWIADSDAVNSIDSYEAMLWFLSRGDECLNCSLFNFGGPLIIRVHKSPG